jgi:hypothetical protein
MLKNTLLNSKVMIGIVVLTVLLLCATFSFIVWLNPLIFKTVPVKPPAFALTVIPAITSTPRYLSPTPSPIPLTPLSTSTPIPGIIALNTYVQISGTGGDGLRLRASPGINSDPLFLGNDSEVFLVIDGPSQADGYTWWYLTAPYDQTRSGWAVANYLIYVPSP